MSLLADAGHNLSDGLGLDRRLRGAAGCRGGPPTSRFTYGLRGSSILAALFNAVFLLVVVGGLSWEAVLRLDHPEPVAGGTVMVVAAIGIVVNGVHRLAVRLGPGAATSTSRAPTCTWRPTRSSRRASSWPAS